MDGCVIPAVEIQYFSSEGAHASSEPFTMLLSSESTLTKGNFSHGQIKNTKKKKKKEFETEASTHDIEFLADSVLVDPLMILKEIGLKRM
ncbi:hypothetical protein TNCV_4088511 [Trichonephila clavipes]|nr:hypothetical protein TNCV_4088511 [Trichonephila clavipes]